MSRENFPCTQVLNFDIGDFYQADSKVRALEKWGRFYFLRKIWDVVGYVATSLREYWAFSGGRYLLL
jgi:hypothetical protein